MSDKKQTAVEWFTEQLIKQGYFDKDIPFITQSTFDKLQQRAKAMEQEQSIICKDCGEIITAEQINNHLFMKMEGGGLIHWKC